MDEAGSYVKDERVIVFGVGKRRCPGEVLAKAEVFLFVTRIVQQFKLSSPNPEKISFTAIPGLVFYPKDYELVAEER